MREERKSFKGFNLLIKLASFGKHLRLYFALLITVMVLVGIIDAFLPRMIAWAVDSIVESDSLEVLPRFAWTYLGIVVFQSANVFLLIALAGKIEMDLSHEIRRKGFSHLQELSFSYYDKTAVGWIMTRMTSDATRLGEVISWGLVDTVWGISTMVAMVYFMLITDWFLAMAVIVLLPILMLVSRFFQGKILKTQRLVRRTNSRISGAFNEGIMGAKATKVLARESGNLEDFMHLTGRMKRNSIRSAVFTSLYLPIVLMIGSMGTALVLYLAGIKVQLGLGLEIGLLLMFIMYTIQFFEPVRELARVLSEIQSATASAERVISMIETEVEIKDSAEVAAFYGTTFHPRTENWPRMRGEIEFRNVDFYYNPEEPVLKDFSLHVPAGRTIALVGETGSGKSTIVNLACRFYEPKKGKILIDGTDYRERSQLWLHSHLGYVLQSPQLFSGSIRENIRYGRLDASEEEITEAASLVGALEFISKLEQGFDTPVGEGGSLLSTGEKQLISFARAILADPALLILDEATSSVDTETEQKIQHAIESLLKGRTAFIVAHRLSTIKNANTILVLKNGRIVEQGSHKELISLQGYYYRLYSKQFLEEEERELLSLKDSS
jgi:ATP-binding cassette subfamily B protein